MCLDWPGRVRAHRPAPPGASPSALGTRATLAAIGRGLGGGAGSPGSPRVSPCPSASISNGLHPLSGAEGPSKGGLGRRCLTRRPGLGSEPPAPDTTSAPTTARPSRSASGRGRGLGASPWRPLDARLGALRSSWRPHLVLSLVTRAWPAQLAESKVPSATLSSCGRTAVTGTAQATLGSLGAAGGGRWRGGHGGGAGSGAQVAPAGTRSPSRRLLQHWGVVAAGSWPQGLTLSCLLSQHRGVVDSPSQQER